MKHSDRFVFRFYDTKEPMLVIYNFDNNGTYYYDSISALLLNAILTDNNSTINEIKNTYQLTDIEISDFISETFLLLNTNSSQLTNINECIDSAIDDQSIISEIHNYMYQQQILYRFHIDITPACNFRCVHCYHTFEEYSNQMLSIEEIDVLFKKLHQMGVFVITISGGEPFLRKDIFEILELGNKYGFVFQILTNGYLLNEEIIKVISTNYNVKKLSFSYYGSDKSFESITGSNTFRNKLMDVVRLCQKYELSYELKFVMLQDNIYDFDDYTDLCKELGIRPQFEPCLIPKLNGDNSNFDHKIDFDTYVIFMKNHKEYFYDGIDITKYCNSPINCSAGKDGLYCDYQGNIYPCVSYREYLGDYKDIENIWYTNNKLKSLRNRLHKQFISFNKYSFCKYCYQICPGLSLCENGNSLECFNSGCMVARVIETINDVI